MIAFRGVGHTYRPLLGRRVRAVDDFSLDIAAGEVVGIAGPNGAGKTTLIAALLGFLHPSDGEVRIAGQAPRAYVERHGVSYLPELMALPTFWRVDNALRRLGVLAGLPAGELEAAVTAVIDRVDLDEHRRKTIKALSKGNFQRLGLAQALLSDHRVIVFDEPTHGLDPVWSNRFRDLVGELRRPDGVIFIASHNLDELERLCDRVVIIDHGRMQRVVSIATEAVAATAWLLRVSARGERLAAHFASAEPLTDGTWLVRGAGLEALNTGLAAALAAGVQVTSVVPHESSLEFHFREAVRR
ncbi:MAG: ABC transporter ATP-binding protein [Gemmatimonadaceae bacterium]